MESGEDLAPDQAISLQAQSAIQSDSRLDGVESSIIDFLKGVAAALATVQLRDPSLVDRLHVIKKLKKKNQKKKMLPRLRNSNYSSVFSINRWFFSLF